MKANAVPLLAIFEKKLRLEVPLFQRQYVWGRDQQWQPLWEDIARKFTEYLEGRKDAPVHFLGAMVLDQKQTPTTHVEKRQVIDGQQRLTTLQIFLASFRDFCREQDNEELARECESFTMNKGMMAEPDVNRFKVWPTQLDRAQFSDAVATGSRASLENKHPLIKKRFTKYFMPRPPMVEAYLFFYDQIREFFIGSPDAPPVAIDYPLHLQLEECFQALKNSLQVVVIDLEQDDDAQVIFETLNARGEPLLPADLLRNYIFLRAARNGEPQEQLYKQYWQRFDEPFWREEIRQGRLNRPRSDLFMQHLLASRLAVDIPVKHLFVEYKFWIERTKPFASVRDEVAKLAQQGDSFRRLLQRTKDDVLYPLATLLERFDISTVYPLLLRLMELDLEDLQWKTISTMLESYLIRRSICGMTTKNYNRAFLTLTRQIHQGSDIVNTISRYLCELKGESVGWPNDALFHSAWRTRDLYKGLQSQRLAFILARLNEAYLGPKNERLTIEGDLSIEHIMPQNWIENWPLSDESKGLTEEQIGEVPTTPRAVESVRRTEKLHTLGNLTILTQELNSSVSNSAWKSKKPALLAASLLPINQMLHPVEKWDESAIDNRSAELYKTALKLWPAPPTGA